MRIVTIVVSFAQYFHGATSFLFLGQRLEVLGERDRREGMITNINAALCVTI